MAEEESKQVSRSPLKTHDVSAKWDACLDLSIRRLFYSSLTGAFGGLLLFRSPVSRWASIAFGAGVGLGTAYTECSYIFGGSPMRVSLPSTEAPVPPDTAQIEHAQHD